MTPAQASASPTPSPLPTADEQPFGEIVRAAGAEPASPPAVAESDGGVSTPHAPGTSQPATQDPNLFGDSLQREFRENVKAHRTKRWVAFISAGVVCAIFFLLLAAVFFRIFFGDLLVGVVGAAANNSSWHALIFLGGAMVLLAAIPLSLAMAMVKMISDRDREEGGDIKTPNVELGKVLVDLLKAITAAVKN